MGLDPQNVFRKTPSKMTATHKKRKTNKKCKKDIEYLANLINDINQKMSHIIDQLSDMYAAIDVIDDFMKYSRN